MYDFLKKVPLFADLPEEDLARLCGVVEEVKLPAGKELFAEGDSGDKAYVIMKGEVDIIKLASGREVLLAVRGPGTVVGEMAVLEETPRTATVRARGDVVFIAISDDQMNQLLDNSTSAAKALLHTVLARWRNTTSQLRHSEKMAQLGTLTAGVAHELNNPAAAVKRGSGQLQNSLPGFAQAQSKLGQLGLDQTQQATLDTLAQRAREQAKRPAEMDAMVRSDLEYELEIWLEDQSVDNAWEIAPTLVNLEYNMEELNTLAQQFDTKHLPTVIDWLGATYTVHNLLAEIGQGANRISGIVKALKSYAYLDQAPVQSVNISEGLNDTLLILRSKLKTGVSVRREYAPDLPNIEGYGSELNQVWTNIIDNATDALSSTPDATITIRTRSENEWVIVEIQDNGPGIPPDVQPRVFDPFFTTKPPGKGTGLGLDISYNIVINKHRGDIKLSSRPGSTCFQIWLPINFETTNDNPLAGESLTEESAEELQYILENAKTIAVVGMSDRKDRPSNIVPTYLQEQGYRIIPVNPKLDRVLGEKAYPDLPSVLDPIDIVLIFRSSDVVMPIVEQAIQVGAGGVIWMQLGIENEEAAQIARESGIKVIMNTCMMATHKHLIGDRTTP
ncbi:MAG: cyclic nucleotide-binding domain-containing protein [Chloroflexi bacterium]|nr:cyclic nucleotide-binding domain-containing protein [Chloroflexota bacterium]